MDPTLVPGTRFESQFQICVYEHAILRIYISFFPTFLTYLGLWVHIEQFFPKQSSTDLASPQIRI